MGDWTLLYAFASLLTACRGTGGAPVVAGPPSVPPVASIDGLLPAPAAPSREDVRPVPSTTQRPTPVAQAEEPQVEIVGKCLASGGSRRSWMIDATIVNPGDTPVAMLRSDVSELVEITFFEGLDDDSLGGGGTGGISAHGRAGGASSCRDARDIRLVPAFGRRSLGRIVVDDVPAEYRGHRVKLGAQLQLVLVQLERPCGPTRAIEREVTVECKPRR
jgi:hypothetical protein